MAPERRNQKPPLKVEAPTPSSDAATFIFLHGYSDEGDAWEHMAHQFHSASHLQHLTFLFPNAPINQEAMTTAWYTPTSFSPIPVGRSSAESVCREKENMDKEFEEEFEGEMWESVEYVEALIEAEIEKGVRRERIVLGGFSQGCAIGLLTALAGRYKGSIGGCVALSGYLPRGKRAWEGREGLRRETEAKGSEMKVFLAHGTRDMLVPMRVFRDAKARVESTLGEERVEAHEYEGLGHAGSAVEYRDICAFLEKVVPA